MNPEPDPAVILSPVRSTIPVTVTKPVILPKTGVRYYLRKVFWYGFISFTVLVLVGLAVPLGGSVCVKGSQTKALAQAKSVGLALKLFAGDHDGNYPRAGVPDLMKDEPTNSNTAFACLFPTYIQNEMIFGNKLSAYQTRVPDNIIDSPYTGVPLETLRPGENVYGYMMGLTDASDRNPPLVVEGTDGTRHYNTVPQVRGGVWGKAKHAVVIHLDNSGTLDNLRGPDNSLYIPRIDDPGRNALDASYLGKGTHYVDPAIAGP